MIVTYLPPFTIRPFRSTVNLWDAALACCIRPTDCVWLVPGTEHGE